MKTEVKVLLGIGLITIVILIGAVFLLPKGSSTLTGNTIQPEDEKLLVKNDSNKTGAVSASIKIVEFGDYQCPACGAVHPTLKRLTIDYKDKIMFVFRNFPLPQHMNAKVAAEAAEAAGEQNKYWEMHDMLYENQDKWADSTKPLDIFSVYAKELDMNIEKFKKAVQGLKFDEKIQSDINDGNSLGVNSTPTIFINNTKYEGVPDYDSLKKIVDSLIKR